MLGIFLCLVRYIRFSYLPTDLTQNKIQLDAFKGVVLPGGFSFGDVTGSSKGWAAAIK